MRGNANGGDLSTRRGLATDSRPTNGFCRKQRPLPRSPQVKGEKGPSDKKGMKNGRRRGGTGGVRWGKSPEKRSNKKKKALLEVARKNFKSER